MDTKYYPLDSNVRMLPETSAVTIYNKKKDESKKLHLKIGINQAKEDGRRTLKKDI